MAVDKLVDSTQLDADLTSVANAIRTKGGTSADLAFPSGFVSAVQAIPTGGGGDELVRMLVTGNVTGNLTLNDTSLRRCFSNTIGDYTLDMPNLISIDVEYAVEKSTGIKEFTAAELTVLARYAFYCASNIRKIFTPKANANRYAAQNATSLVVAVIKSLREWTQFVGCQNLKTVDITASTFTKSDQIDNTWQTNCGNFDTLVIRGNSVITLVNSTAFNGSKFKSGGSGGTIYIPKSLYDHLGDGTSLDYKAATNWSTVDGYGTITWAKIEGSIYETQYADGTPIT